jgi:ribosomal protein L22
MADEESGIDELMRLSRQFTRQQEQHEAIEKQREAQGKKVKGVLQGLKDLNVSMAIQQLKMVARPDIIRQVNDLKTKTGTEDLRKMITVLADGLEKQIGAVSASKNEMTPLINSMRTLSILIDLYFSLH